MNKFIMLLIFILIPLSLNAQVNSGSFRLNDKQQFRTFFTAGGGMLLQERYGEWENSANISFELDIHTGRGYLTGFGFNHHSIPGYEDNKATYFFILERKGIYLMNNFAVYAGIGGTIGVTTKGHPGCCVGGAYFSIMALYDIHKYVSLGLEGKSFTDFDDLSIIPGIQIALRF